MFSPADGVRCGRACSGLAPAPPHRQLLPGGGAACGLHATLQPLPLPIGAAGRGRGLSPEQGAGSRVHRRRVHAIHLQGEAETCAGAQRVRAGAAASRRWAEPQLNPSAVPQVSRWVPALSGGSDVPGFFQWKPVSYRQPQPVLEDAEPCRNSEPLPRSSQAAAAASGLLRAFYPEAQVFGLNMSFGLAGEPFYGSTGFLSWWVLGSWAGARVWPDAASSPPGPCWRAWALHPWTPSPCWWSA